MMKLFLDTSKLFKVIKTLEHKIKAKTKDQTKHPGTEELEEVTWIIFRWRNAQNVIMDYDDLLSKRISLTNHQELWVSNNKKNTNNNDNYKNNNHNSRRNKQISLNHQHLNTNTDFFQPRQLTSTLYQHILHCLSSPTTHHHQIRNAIAADSGTYVCRVEASKEGYNEDIISHNLIHVHVYQMAMVSLVQKISFEASDCNGADRKKVETHLTGNMCLDPNG